MNSQFTIPRKKIEDYVRSQMDEIMKSANITYEVGDENIESLNGDRTYFLNANITVELSVPVAHLVEESDQS